MRLLRRLYFDGCLVPDSPFENSDRGRLLRVDAWKQRMQEDALVEWWSIEGIRGGILLSPRQRSFPSLRFFELKIRI